MLNLNKCPGCGVERVDASGPNHPYFSSSPECWKDYSYLLAEQCHDLDRIKYLQLIVDTYAVQHSGDMSDPRQIQSAGIHLMTLELFLTRDVDPTQGNLFHRMFINRPNFTKLTPPKVCGDLTIDDVPLGQTIKNTRDSAYAWATNVWDAWEEHHETITRWVNKSLG